LLFSLAGLLLPPPSFALDPVVDLTGDWSGTGQEKWYYDLSGNFETLDLVCTGDWELKVTIKQNGNTLDIQVNGKLTNAIDHILGFDCEEDSTSFKESLKGTIDGSKITVFDPAHGKLLGTYTSAGIKIQGKIPDEEGFLEYKVQLKPNFTPPKIGTDEDSKDDVTPETTAKLEPKTTIETTTGLQKCKSSYSEGKDRVELRKCLRNLKNLNSCEVGVYFQLISGSTASSNCQGTIKFGDIQISAGKNTEYTISKKDTPLVTVIFGKLKIIGDFFFKDEKPKMEIKTKTVSMGVRGTEFIVDYDSTSDITTVLVLEGTIEIGERGLTYTFSDESKFTVTDYNAFDPQSGIQTETFSISEWNDLSAEITQTAQVQTTQPTATGTGGGCLIATATYGSELAPQVQQLRELRDNSLLNTESGTSFMESFNDVYYSFSPIIADYERENPVFKEMVKIAITPMISSLSILNYVDMDSEAEVLGYGISLIVLNLAMYVGIPASVIIGIRRI